jgi:hypothetical protein
MIRLGGTTAPASCRGRTHVCDRLESIALADGGTASVVPSDKGMALKVWFVATDIALLLPLDFASEAASFLKVRSYFPEVFLTPARLTVALQELTAPVQLRVTCICNLTGGMPTCPKSHFVSPAAWPVLA